jgi:fibronectin type 3 domain-containing protein
MLHIPVSGQSNFVHSSPNGIIVFTGYDIHYSGAIDITKGIKKRKKKSLTTLRRVDNKFVFISNIEKYENLLPYLPPISPDARDSLWNVSQDISKSLTYLPNVTLYYLSMGLAYLDEDVEPGETYTYAISYMKDGQRTERESDPIIYGESAELPIASYESSHYEGQSVKTMWSCPMVPTLHSFKAFRQDNDRGDFIDVHGPMIYTKSGNDTLTITCYDTSAVEHYSYKYILKAVDLFSNLGPSSDTITLNSFYSSDLPYLKRFKVENTGANRQLKVRWEFESKPYLRGIVIERSREFDRDYRRIAEVAATDTVYYDYVDEAHENYYYRLRWIGPDSVSAPTVVAAGHYIGTEVADSIGDLTATTVENGVLLEWTDYQPFVLGYMIYRRQVGQDSFIQVAPQHPFDSIGEQAFIDTSEELSGNMFYEYYVSVINDNYLISKPSDTVRSRPGIKRVLRSPSGLRARKHEGTVHLLWDDMQQFEPDLYKYEVYRMRLGEDSLSILEASLNAESNHFKDENITRGSAYGYAVKVFDRYGNTSELSDTLFVAFPFQRPIPPSGIKAFVTDNAVEIRWDEFNNQPDVQYKVYRSTNGNTPLEIATVGYTFDRYQDSDAQVGQELIYYVTTVDKNGMESEPSEKVIVEIEIN